MKKISLGKQTLRVLTSQEAGQVAGGAITMPATKCPTSQMPECTDTAYCQTYTCNCTAGCTVGCTPQTQGCPPHTTNNPRAKCACPDQ